MEWLIPRVNERWGCVVPSYLAGTFVLLIPVILRWVPLWYALLDLIIIGATGLAGLAYVVAMNRAAKRRNLLDWTSDLRRLDADEFEWLVHELFTREGYTVDKIGSQHHGDGNIDLVLTRDAARLIVQCKRWTSWFVGPDDVQRFAGTYPPGGQVTGRVFVTLSDFTAEARTAAERSGVVLVDGSELADRLQRVRKTEPCPECGTPMLLDRSIRGWWLRCPRCPGKRDLSRDPGRAVDLLLDQQDANAASHLSA